MNQPMVVIVDDVQVKTAMDAAEAHLRARGCRIGRYPTMDALAADGATLAQADVLVVSSNYRCTREIMAAAKNLRAVIFPASGTETMDFAAARELGIVVGHGAFPENSESMAESTLLLVLASLYDLHRSEWLLRNKQPRPATLYAHMLKGRTVGLVGFGRIGQAIASRLQNWNAHILAYSPHIGSKTLPADVRASDLDDLLRQSDVVCIVCALNEQTRGMIDARRLQLMKRTAILVNTSRGAIVDEPALHEALKEKRIAKAALDTFVVEPLPHDSPLRTLENVVLTPHIVGHTLDATEAGDRNLIEGIERVLRGEPPPYVRNPEVIAAWRARWSASN
jgi:D-3-phosphoglycerate dehydrogenase